MRLVFVTGIDESNRDEILDMVTRGLRNQLPRFRYLKFSDFVNIEKDKEGNFSIGDLKNMKKIQEKFYKKLKKEVVKNMKQNSSVILNSYLTLKTEHGFLPLVDEEFFDVFRPDVILVLEVDMKLNSHQKRNCFGSRENYDSAKEIQETNRDFAVQYSSMCNSVLKFTKVHPDSIKIAIRDVSNILRFGMKE